MTNAIDLTSERTIHVVGAGGAGMSAISGVLAAMGHRVSGSDQRTSTALEEVSRAGVVTWTGSAPERMDAGTDAVVISTAVPASDPEVAEARKRGVAVLRRADALASIAATRRTVAVAGTHGKTTTSTLLALALEAGGVRPSWIIGGEIVGRGNGYHWDGGQWFVVEADESDGTFLELGAEAALVTNIEPDHLETYGDWAGLQEAFRRFVGSVGGPSVMCADDPESARLAASTGAVTYGQAAGASYRIVETSFSRFTSQFALVHDGDKSAAITLHSAGLHNVTNAAGALAMAHQLGVPLEAAAAGISAYGGVGRRFTRRGEAGGVTFVDDYAHLPTEVRAAVSAALGGDWPRVVAVFQPHRFSRTQQVGADFGGCFDGVDQLVLAGIYAAGEEPRSGVTGRMVADAVEAQPGHPPVTYVEDREDLTDVVAGLLRPGDLCLSLGAGDVTRLPDELSARLS